MKYICKQLQCKQKVPEAERPEALNRYPHLRDWLRTINLRPELIQVRCHSVTSSVLNVPFIAGNLGKVHLLFCLSK